MKLKGRSEIWRWLLVLAVAAGLMSGMKAQAEIQVITWDSQIMDNLCVVSQHYVDYDGMQNANNANQGITMTASDIAKYERNTDWEINIMESSEGGSFTFTYDAGYIKGIDIAYDFEANLSDLNWNAENGHVRWEGQPSVSVTLSECQQIAGITKIIFTVEPVVHEHQFETDWTYNADDHWHACTALFHSPACLNAPGAEKSRHTFNSDGVCSVCGFRPHKHGDMTFEKWTDTTSLPDQPGNYYLEGDVVLSGTWYVPESTTNLCLNGHGIRNARQSESGNRGSVICIESGAELVLFDEGSATHRYTVDGSGLAIVNDELTENYSTFSGGYITGGNGDHGAGIKLTGSGKLTMYGGTVIGNQAGDSSGYSNLSGGGVCTEPGRADLSEFSMYGGQIIGNTTTGTGGGVFFSGKACTIGGTARIRENTSAGMAGGIGVYAGAMTITGTPEITGNQTGGKNSNLAFLMSGPESTCPAAAVDGMTGGSIGVSILKSGGENSGGVFTTGITDAGRIGTLKSYFTSDNVSYQVITEDNKLALGQPTPYPLWIGGTQVTSVNLSGKGWRFTPATAGENPAPAILDLNGYTFSGAGYQDRYGIYYNGDSDLSIVLTGTNSITGTGTENDCAGIYVSADAGLTISGEGSLAVSCTSGSQSIGIDCRGTLTIDGGTVEAAGAYVGIYGYKGVQIKRGSVTASANYGISGYESQYTLTIGQDVSSVIITGTSQATDFQVVNAVNGTGWTDSAGTEGRKEFDVSSTGQTLAYKKLKFPGHAHSFTYTTGAGGKANTFTAECTAEGCDIPSDSSHQHRLCVELSADDAVVTGNAYTGAKLSDTNELVSTAAKTDTVAFGQIRYSGTGETNYTETETPPTAAGTYEAKVTVTVTPVNGGDAAVYTITKAFAITQHVHRFSIALNEAGDGYTAVCSGDGLCDLTEKKLEVKLNPPANPEYDGTEKEAYLSTISGSETTPSPDLFNQTVAGSIFLGEGHEYKVTGVLLPGMPGGVGYGSETSFVRPVNAGDWTAVCSISIQWENGAENPGQITRSFTIVPQDVNKPQTKVTSVQKAGETLVCTGNANPPTLEVKDGETALHEGADFTVKYTGTAPTEYAESETAPANAGSYKAVLTFRGNYTGKREVPFTIAEADPAGNITEKKIQTITADDVTVTYGDSGRKISAGTDGDGVISFMVRKGSENYLDIASDGILTVKAVPQDGKAYVIVTAAETQTCAQAAKEVTVTIGRAAGAAAAVTANNRTCDNTEQPLVLVDDATLSGGTMYYALGENAETAPGFDGASDAADRKWGTAIPAKTEAGTYYVWYMAKGDENHTDTVPACVTVTVGQQAPENKEEGEAVFNAAGVSSGIKGVNNAAAGSQMEAEAHADDTPVGPGQAKDVKVILEASVLSGDAVPENEKTALIGAAGAIIPPEDADRVNSDFLEMLVEKIVIIYDVDENGEKTENQTITTSLTSLGRVVDIQVAYDLTNKHNPVLVRYHNGEAQVFTRLYAQPAPGTYKDATYFIEGSGADAVIHIYTDRFSTYAILTYGSRDYDGTALILTPPAAKDLVYTGEAQELVTAGSAQNGTMVYALGANALTAPADGWSAAVPAAAEAGTYYVWYKAAGDQGYSDTPAACLTVTIAPADNGGSGEQPAQQPAPEPQTELPAVPAQQEPAAAEAVPAEDPQLSLLSGFRVTCKGSGIYVRAGRVAEADSYQIYAQYCGARRCDLIKTVSAPVATITRINGKKPDMTRCFKVYVAAIKDGRQISRTFMAHVAGSRHEKNTNVRSVSVRKRSFTMKAGETKKIDAKVSLENRRKEEISPKEHDCPRFRYASDNRAVATVSKKGKITAVGSGTCRIWVYAMNGRSAVVKVKVKEGGRE